MEGFWKADNYTIRDRFTSLFEQCLLTDVTFLVGSEKQEFHAHKIVLASGSPVFYTMFYGSLKETSKEIIIPDISSETFLALLRYFYTDTLPDVGSALSVWYAANKYMVTSLTDACRRILKENINPNNVLQVYQEALTYNENDLIDICWYIICSNIRTVLASPFFVKIKYETLTQILNNSRMTIPEVKLYEAAARWAAEACKREGIEGQSDNLRGMLGEALYKIRFPVMSNWEFVEGPAQSGILNEKECFEILMFHLAQHKPKQLSFPMLQRQYIGITVNLRSFLNEAVSYINDRINGVRFQSDKRVLLVGVGITLRNAFNFNEIELRLDSLNSDEYYEETCERRLLKPSLKHKRKNTQFGYSLFLKSPQVIKPDFTYVLSTPPGNKELLRFHPYQTFSQRGVNMLISTEIKENEQVTNPFFIHDFHQLHQQNAYSPSLPADLSYLHFFHKTEV